MYPEFVIEPLKIAWGWTYRNRFRLLGTLCLLIGTGVAAFLAAEASSETPPSGSQSALFVLISGLFQAGGAYSFSRGKPSKDALGLQLQRHSRIAEQIIDAKAIAEFAVDDGTAQATKKAVGELSWRLSQVETDHDDVATSWYQLHNTTLNRSKGQAS